MGGGEKSLRLYSSSRSWLVERCWGHNYPKETDNYIMYIWKCETEVYTRRNHGTPCRDPAPLQDEGCISWGCAHHDSDDPQFWKHHFCIRSCSQTVARKVFVWLPFVVVIIVNKSHASYYYSVRLWDHACIRVCSLDYVLFDRRVRSVP